MPKNKFFHFINALLASIVLLFSITAHAQPGTFDSTFNPIAFPSGYGDGTNAYISKTALQSDGKIIIGGNFTTYNGINITRIARINADGRFDVSFNPGTGANNVVRAIAIQSNGKIIIGGDFTAYNGTAINRIARLNTDGSLDGGFNPGTGANSQVSVITLQSDGKIIIAGGFTNYNGTARNYIARLNDDGSLDATFNPGTGANGGVSTTALQSDGKIIIAGGFTNYNGTARTRIARLNADGSLDLGFDPGTGANGGVNTTSIQSDGKIIIGGSFATYNGTSRNRIARLNADGSLDAGFDPGTGITQVSDEVNSSAIQSDGKIIISGRINTYNGVFKKSIARINADGSLDAGYHIGSGTGGTPYHVSIQSDGKVIIAGEMAGFDGVSKFCIVRLLQTDGSVDLSFNPTIGLNNTINTTTIQSDGKIIIGGDFTTLNGTSRNRIARLNAAGTPDGSFNPGSGANAGVITTAIQSDGKIIIGGFFSNYNGTARNYIARLNTDGSLDAGFNPGTGANNTVFTTAFQSDGKIIIGGQFITYNGTARNCIARLNADGSLDAGFTPGTGANALVRKTLLQSDGKIIIAGDFTGYNGTPRNRIARLNADGTLDGSFNPGTGANGIVYTSAIQSDGKIIIGGDFTAYNGTARNRIARLNSNGNLDATFTPGTGADNTVQATAIQSDGKIIIGGMFNTYNGTGRIRIGRINADGSIDAVFNPGAGANSTVFATAIQSDGKIIIGGSFTTYNGTARNRIARLNTDGSLETLGTGANGGVSTTALRSDGKIIIGGDFTDYNGTAINRIACLNTDGSLDGGFNPGMGADGNVSAVAIQSDGKTIIGGIFTTYNGTAINRVARVNTDGSLDGSFNPGTGANSEVSVIAIQSDGKIIIGGFFASYNATLRNRIARLNADGSLDITFNPGTGADGNVLATAIQSDGKIIIGGTFNDYNGTSRNRIARLNADGSLDVTYNPGTGADGSIFTIAIQSDGKIIIGGAFTTYNGTTRNRIARLNADGSLDATFNPGTGADGSVFTTAIQSDGRIIIGGLFTVYNGTARNAIAGLNADGSLDINFNPGTGANNIVRTTSIQSDGKIIIGGLFTEYNGTFCNRVARILSSSGVVPVKIIHFAGKLNADNSAALYWDVAEQSGIVSYTVQKSSDGIRYTYIGVVEANNLSSFRYNYTDPIAGSGTVHYRLKTTENTGREVLSRIVTLHNKTTATISIFPNPVADAFTILVKGEIMPQQGRIYDANGKQLKVVRITGITQRIDISSLAKGQYFLKFTDGSMYKIMKQ